MTKALAALLRSMFNSLRDLLPILVVVGFFQLVVLQQPIPNLFDLVVGTLFVLLGLTFFIYGLETSLFPLGEAMAYSRLFKTGYLNNWLAVRCPGREYE